MIRDATVWISETLFYLTDGVMLINTVWFLSWVMFWSVAMAMPLIYATQIRLKSWRFALPLLVLFPLITLFAFTTAIAPGIVQQQMMMECKTAEIENTQVMWQGELIDLGPYTVELCRTKQNFYGEFGEWQLIQKTN